VIGGHVDVLAAGFPPTLIGTIYGMNLGLMPELDWGYPWRCS
jgi:Mg2+ and Co2+ transporter CorA